MEVSHKEAEAIAFRWQLGQHRRPSKTAATQSNASLMRSTVIATVRKSFEPLPYAFLFLALVSKMPAQAADGDEDILAGHSYHGESFNEGPRQAAYLMPGLQTLSFPATTESELAQQFVNQGIAQLHGFWYYEAERSFRQAAVHDENCAIAYWGMAMANTGNEDRARGFIEEAMQRIEGVSEREKMYIEAFEQQSRKEDDKGKKIERKDRAQRYTRDLEEIVEAFPDDVEARAFLALQLWQNARADLPIVSYVAVNSVLQDVFDADPNHPAHHYRIHLWDRHKPERAVVSASLCGQSLPGIAHMWHMPGHIFDKLHRYQDAAWQQEASARVDHAHMMRDRVMPDQIHNFAHNNEWLIRSLLKVGRINDALDLAKNMLELPRHPAFNMLSKRGSSRYGRQRLLLALNEYRLWPQLIELADTMYLEETGDPKLQVERLQYLGLALALSDKSEAASGVHAELEQMLEDCEKELTELEAAAESDKEKLAALKKEKQKESAKAKVNRERRKKERDAETRKQKDFKKLLAKAIDTVAAGEAAAAGEWETAIEKFDKSEFKNALLKAEWLMLAGEADKCLELLDKEIEDKPGQLLPLVQKAYALSELEDAEAARETFVSVQSLAANADLDTPILARLDPVAAALGFEEHWADEPTVADDVGERPELDSLGPFRWHPYLAPDFVVRNEANEVKKLKHLGGKPTLVIFYLGFGCLHCVEQLHEFSPRAEQFRSAGIDVMAISTESLDSLKTALDGYSKPLNIPLHADPELAAFKAYRCYDDFEKQPLHGTYLIDPAGRVLWQDISYEPFMDVDFALDESIRLLKLNGYGDQISTPVPTKKFLSLNP